MIDHLAVNFVNKIKQAYKDSPKTYSDFLQILREYQQNPSDIISITKRVELLFENRADLLNEFFMFTKLSNDKVIKKAESCDTLAAETHVEPSNLDQPDVFNETSPLLNDVESQVVSPTNVQKKLKFVLKLIIQVLLVGILFAVFVFAYLWMKDRKGVPFIKD